MKCTICKNSEAKLIYKDVRDYYFPDVPGKFNIRRCGNCGLLWIDPQPTADVLQLHYPNSYPVYQRKVIKPRGLKTDIIKLVAKNYLGYGRPAWWRFLLYPFYLKLAHLPHKKTGRALLDVGCGPVTRFPVFQLLGWDARGVEMDESAAKAAQAMGYNVISSSFESADLPENYFDIIYMSHVFEHLRDPHEVLEKVKQVLKPGGELILIMPNGGSITSKIFGRYWFGLEIPRHLFLYNKKNIVSVLQQHGFECQEVVYNSFLTSAFSSLSYAIGKNADYFSFMNRFVWLLNFVTDIFMNPFGVGDEFTVRAKYNPTNRP